MDRDTSTSAPKLGRVRKGLRRHDMRGALRVFRERIVRIFYVNEAHRWYKLDLSGKRPQIGLPEGFHLVEAGERELPLLDTLPTVKLDEGQRRLGDGNSLWLLMEGDRAAFACWTFYNRMPVGDAGEGVLNLPQGAAALEDSVTSPDYRGAGLGGYALMAICERLVEGGYQTLLTKIAEDNATSRRAAERAGFEDIALMRTMRTIARRRTEVETGDNGVGSHLAKQLNV